MDQVTIHVYSWTITLILFVICFALLKAGKMKPQKIVHMILRLFYILTLLTGIGIIFSYNFMGAALIKGALAIILLILMELLLVKTRDRDNTAFYWILFLIDLVLVFYYGYVVI